MSTSSQRIPHAIRDLYGVVTLALLLVGGAYTAYLVGGIPHSYTEYVPATILTTGPLLLSGGILLTCLARFYHHQTDTRLEDYIPTGTPTHLADNRPVALQSTLSDEATTITTPLAETEAQVCDVQIAQRTASLLRRLVGVPRFTTIDQQTLTDTDSHLSVDDFTIALDAAETTVKVAGGTTRVRTVTPETVAEDTPLATVLQTAGLDDLTTPVQVTEQWLPPQKTLHVYGSFQQDGDTLVPTSDTVYLSATPVETLRTTQRHRARLWLERSLWAAALVGLSAAVVFA